MGFFGRLSNLWHGFLSLFIEDLERENPDAVYTAAINERVASYQKLMKAVSGIVYLRNKLQADLEKRTKELEELHRQIPVAVQTDEAAALVLIERKQVLSNEIQALQADLEKVSHDADDAKANLITFQTEIEKLKQERETMLARRENAKARLKLQESLSGLSVESDIRALDNVRESIKKMEAHADVSREVQGAGMSDRLKKIREGAATSAAKAELDELKKQMQSQNVQNIEKTM